MDECSFAGSATAGVATVGGRHGLHEVRRFAEGWPFAQGQRLEFGRMRAVDEVGYVEVISER